MDYAQNHVRDWLAAHTYISLGKLEEDVGCPAGTIRHFLKDRRALPNKYLGTMNKLLYDYGYRSIGEE